MEVRRTEWEPWWELVMNEIFIGGSDRTEPYEETQQTRTNFQTFKSILEPTNFELKFYDITNI